MATVEKPYTSHNEQGKARFAFGCSTEKRHIGCPNFPASGLSRNSEDTNFTGKSVDQSLAGKLPESVQIGDDLLGICVRGRLQRA